MAACNGKGVFAHSSEWREALARVQGVWQRLDTSDCERFTLVWETKELIQLNWNLTQFALALVSPACASLTRLFSIKIVCRSQAASLLCWLPGSNVSCLLHAAPTVHLHLHLQPLSAQDLHLTARPRPMAEADGRAAADTLCWTQLCLLNAIGEVCTSSES